MKKLKINALFLVLACLCLGIVSCGKEQLATTASPDNLLVPNSKVQFYHQLDESGMASKIELAAAADGSVTVTRTTAPASKSMRFVDFKALNANSVPNASGHTLRYTETDNLWFVPFGEGVPEKLDLPDGRINLDCNCDPGSGCTMEAQLNGENIDYSCGGSCECLIMVSFSDRIQRPAGIVVPASQLRFRTQADQPAVEVMETETYYTPGDKPGEMFALTLTQFANGKYAFSRHLTNENARAELTFGMVSVGSAERDLESGHISNLGARTRFVPFDPKQPTLLLATLAGIDIDCNCSDGSCDLSGTINNNGGVNYQCGSRNCGDECSMIVTFSDGVNEPVGISGAGLLIAEEEMH